MAWFRAELTEDEQWDVNWERVLNPGQPHAYLWMQLIFAPPAGTNGRVVGEPRSIGE